MSGPLRASRLYTVLGVGLAHVLLFIVLSKHHSTPHIALSENPIQIVLVTPPKKAEAPVPDIVQKDPVPVPQKPQQTENTPTRKSRVKTSFAPQAEEKNQKTGTAKTTLKRVIPGAFLVRLNTGRPGALGIFHRGLDCSRLDPKVNRQNCSPASVNLMEGMDAKIAAVSAQINWRRGRGSGSDTLFGIEPGIPGSTQPLSTHIPTGAPIIGENFGRLPPKYPDPAFGD